MAEEPLVARALSQELVAAGKALIERLDQVRFPVTAAFWVFLADSNLWRLVIATPEVRLAGRKRAYRRIQSLLKKVPNTLISLADIAVVDTTDPSVNLLKVAIGTPGPPSVSGISFIGNVINGVRFPDAYIYRSS